MACLSIKVLPVSLFLLLSIFTFLSSNSYGQCEPVDALSCEDAPLMELENFCGRTTSMLSSCCNNFCGNSTSVHNPTFLKFIALDTFIQLDILVLPCENGSSAIQAAIIKTCPWENIDILDCDAGAGEGQTIVLTSGGITVGNEYWLLIDGSSASACNFLITDVTGLSVAGSTEVSLQQIADTLYVIPEELPQGSYSYAWLDCNENVVLDTTPAFVPPASGCYCVTVRDAVKANTFCTTVVLTGSAEIETPIISIFPNPSRDMVEISIRNANGKLITVHVLDWLGQQVDQFTVIEGNHRYNWDNMIPGVYVFIVKENDRMLSYEKVVYSGR